MRTEKQKASTRKFNQQFRTTRRAPLPVQASAPSWWAIPMSRDEFTAKAKDADARMNAVRVSYETKVSE